MQAATKMPFYSFVNSLLAGLVFIGACMYMFWNDIQPFIKSIVSADSGGIEIIITISIVAIAYEVGYLIFRIGAIVIEPFFKEIDGRLPYPDFVVSCNKYPILADLSREYGYSRTRVILFAIIGVLSAFKAELLLSFICVVCILVFIITMKSHTKKINDIVRKNVAEESSLSSTTINKNYMKKKGD